MIVKEFRELRRDHRTVAMLVALPLLMLVIFGYAANFTVDELKVAVVGDQADQVQQLVAEAPQDAPTTLDLTDVDAEAGSGQARDMLRDDEVDVAILSGDASDAAGGRPTVLVDGSNLFAAQSASVLVAQLGDRVDSEILYNPDLETSWVMVPAIIGLILTFIGTIITSIGLVREREAGTLEQLAVMPLSPTSVVLGKISPYFLLACFDMVLVTLLGVWLFGVPFRGSALLFGIGAAIFLFAVLGIGVLISTVSQTTGQAVQVALMTMLPQILLSGMIFPLDAMAAGVRWIGYLLPLTWFVKLSQGVMLRGAGWESMWLPVVVLTAMAVLVFGVAVVRLRRDIAPARGAR
ncbi:ABC transporter permease [Isoptericola sediminis]|uniref:ABC transporter permease n=1 Tax=Isoptericola sediminis TaxID=2733572 RepID=A0A849K2K0_9MICO|nr:ABC transporter permease [Isoptericola sediminis]NNU26510.1 ABC transporter permease [Isoptericola sediminis]